MTLPQTLWRLRQVKPLGSGGFAEVWLYHDPALDSPVAVKVLSAQWTQAADIRERFLQEARFLRSVDSPHVVSVHDIGETPAGAPYFVMAYADAGSVAELIAQHPQGMPPELVADLVTQAAAGLDALHVRSVIHRDVKPANILLAGGSDGRLRAMVADLGVARALDQHTEVTRQIGTPAYMAPEQFDESLPIDHRADVRSLGAVAWAMFAGRSPAPALTVVSRVPDLGTVSPVPATVSAVIMRALEPRAEDRWPDAGSFAAALTAATEGRAVAVPPPSDAPTMLRAPGPAPSTPMPPPPPQPRPSRRRRNAVLVAAAVAIALVLGGAATWFVSRGGPVEEPANGGETAAGQPVSGAETAAVRFVEALQAGDCEAAGLYMPDLDDPASWDCTDDANGGDGFYFHILEDLDAGGERRVEDLGDGLFRVVWVDQGYVNMQRQEDSLFKVERVVCC
ncbi:serine/threonine protein kinase [Nocardioides sp. KC13]|uniref:non-specific serine/threonine protein kinase n=1 Tax=Nocardioides turkmenicus TaxID=2711220 RepID=A0A6M1QVJ5_9ACTN|nr:serine/threonine protein kinase [Nocardioides sp. KC13]